jgi:type IV fimbrial biogenesis protein FimT
MPHRPHPAAPSCQPGRRAHPARQRGASLVEALVVLVIVAITLGAALPSFAGLRDRQRLESLAAQLETDIHHARSLAVARNQVLRLGFGTGAGPGCYVLHTGSSPTQCSCGGSDGAATCSGGAEALRSVALAPADGLQLQANVSAMAFEPLRGTVTPTGTLRLANGRGERVHLVVNLMGRVRACTPNGAPGWPAC